MQTVAGQNQRKDYFKMTTLKSIEEALQKYIDQAHGGGNGRRLLIQTKEDIRLQITQMLEEIEKEIGEKKIFPRKMGSDKIGEYDFDYSHNTALDTAVEIIKKKKGN